MSNNPQTTVARAQTARATSRRPSISSAQVATDVDNQPTTLIHLNPHASTTHSPNTSPSQIHPHEEDEEVEEVEEKRCWICFVSDSEEDQTSAEWRAPCKCTLVAHEACLLDWITDMQKSGRENGSNGKPACPQCKTPVRLKQEPSVVLDIADNVGRMAGKAGAFLAFGGVGSVLFVGCTVYGVNTIYTICGPEYASEILLGRDSEFQWTWRLGIGLPLIPFVLIASRIRLFDSVLPVLPVVFFCHTDPLHFTLPPSPQITLAVLPYVRSFYNAMWQRYVAAHEARWIKETTPKFALENAEAQQRQRANGEHLQRGGDDLNAVDVEIHEWDGEVRLENHNIILQGNNVTSLVLGALLWPSVAKMIGQSLGKLPAAWGGDRIRKWLPTHLARNVVGGLMVVVLKDFISLYCKYKRAQRFRSRSVMNYSESKATRKRTTASFNR